MLRKVVHPVAEVRAVEGHGAFEGRDGGSEWLSCALTSPPFPAFVGAAARHACLESLRRVCCSAAPASRCRCRGERRECWHYERRGGGRGRGCTRRDGRGGLRAPKGGGGIGEGRGRRAEGGERGPEWYKDPRMRERPARGLETAVVWLSAWDAVMCRRTACKCSHNTTTRSYRPVSTLIAYLPSPTLCHSLRQLSPRRSPPPRASVPRPPPANPRSLRLRRLPASSTPAALRRAPSPRCSPPTLPRGAAPRRKRAKAAMKTPGIATMMPAAPGRREAGARRRLKEAGGLLDPRETRGEGRTLMCSATHPLSLAVHGVGGRHVTDNTRKS